MPKLQMTLFEENATVKSENDIKEHWKGMPAYNYIEMDDPVITATFKFRNEEDFKKFKKIVKEILYENKEIFNGAQTRESKHAWYPLENRPSTEKQVYVDESTISNIHNQ